MLIIDQLAEQRIQEALARGELDDLPGAGVPLEIEEDPFVPEELRMAMRVLRNAGYLPPELALRAEIHDTAMLVESSTDAAAERRALKKLQRLMLRLDLEHARGMNLALQDAYYRRVLRRLAGLGTPD